MGDENGLDLIKAIRKHKPSIKTIYMTGDLIRYHSEIEDERRLYHVGLLEKPFKGSDLAELISRSTHPANSKRQREIEWQRDNQTR